MIRSHRDLLAVARGGVEERWVFTVTDDDEKGYALSLESPNGDSWESRASNAWDALRKLREKIEPINYRLCCNGARVDAYVSPMSISMTNGGFVYILPRWRQPRLRRDMVEIFAYAPPVKVGTISEQDEFFDRWKRRWWMHLV